MWEKIPQPIKTEAEKNDATVFAVVQRLTESEGWRFRGNMFRHEQYELVLSKDGEEDKKFLASTPYPLIADGSGRMVKIP